MTVVACIGPWSASRPCSSMPRQGLCMHPQPCRPNRCVSVAEVPVCLPSLPACLCVHVSVGPCHVLGQQ
jgi:hypothetical protein